MDKFLEHFTSIKKKSRLYYAIFALFVAVLYDIVFWDKVPSLGYGIFTTLYVTGFITLTHYTKQFRNKWALLLLIPMAVMCIDLFLYNNDLVTNAVPVFLAIQLFLFSVLATLKNPSDYKFSFAKIPLISNILGIFKYVPQLMHDAASINKSTRRMRTIFMGVIFSIPIVLIFGMLFASADAVFADWIGDFFDSDISGDTIWRLIRTVVLTILISGFFYVLVSDHHKLGQKIAHAIKFDRGITTVVLTITNVFFFTFVFIQLQYLFGNYDFVIDQGITFASYARNGFFEMVWVIALAAIIIGTLYKSFCHHGHSKAVTALQVLLVLQVTVIACSALKRMNVYQEAYGYTVLRLYVEWFIYLMITLLLFGAGSIVAKLPFRKFFYSGMAISLAALTIVTSINVDFLIARQNINRFFDKEPDDKIHLDINYLNELSVDIVPVLNLINPNSKEVNMASIRTIKNTHKEKYEEKDSLMEFNYGEYKAFKND